MSIPKSSHLAMASNVGLNRFDCIKCASETLHRYGACVHCGTSILQKPKRKKLSMRESIERQALMQQSRSAK